MNKDNKKFAIDIEGTDSWHEDKSETKLLYKHEGTFSEVTYPNDTVCNNIEIECCGLQHFRIQKFLCSVDDKYAVLRGKAILLWKYDYHNGNKWFSFNCAGAYFANSSAVRHGMCRACFTETKKFEGTYILGSLMICPCDSLSLIYCLQMMISFLSGIISMPWLKIQLENMCNFWNQMLYTKHCLYFPRK